jgi:hypothetical protein
LYKKNVLYKTTKMNSLKDTLRSYQKNLDRGEFFYNQDDHQNALKYYNLAIGELYNAKEMCQYSDELQTLKENDVKFKTWLHNKTQSIKSQLSALVKYTKELQQSVNYAVTLNKTTKTITEPQSTTRPSSPKHKTLSRVSQKTTPKDLQHDKTTPKTSSSSRRHSSSRRESVKKRKNDSFPDLVDDLDDESNYTEQRNNNSNWKELAERSIKLLCHLRGIYDFNDKDKEFEKIFRQRQIYIKEERR